MAKTFSIHSTLNAFEVERNGMRRQKKYYLIKATTFDTVCSQYFIFIILIWMKMQKCHLNFAFAQESCQLLREKSVWDVFNCKKSRLLLWKVWWGEERNTQPIPTCHSQSRFFWWAAILSIHMQSTLFWRAVSMKWKQTW